MPLLDFARLVDWAGFPAGMVNILTGGPEAGKALTTHPKVAHIAFSGGLETARHIVRASAENLSKTSQERGGKSPFIVFEDADLDSAANAQVVGIFAATGQSCVAGSRLLVQRGVKEDFPTRLKTRAEAVAIGAPGAMETEVGPLCTERQRDRIVAQSVAAAQG